jgi:hypothetical protein
MCGNRTVRDGIQPFFIVAVHTGFRRCISRAGHYSSRRSADRIFEMTIEALGPVFHSLVAGNAALASGRKP